MDKQNVPQNKILFVCGFTCVVCGLIVFILSLFDDERLSGWKIALGVINIINGCLFLVISRQQK